MILHEAILPESPLTLRGRCYSSIEHTPDPMLARPSVRKRNQLAVPPRKLLGSKASSGITSRILGLSGRHEGCSALGVGIFLGMVVRFNTDLDD